MAFKPVDFKHVTLDDCFWKPRMDINRSVTLPIEYEQCHRTGRIDAWKLEWKPGQPDQPHYFWDSDVAKWIEAAAYSLAVHPDPELAARVDDVIDLIAAAQQPDGYLNLYFTVVEPEKRWTNLRDCHELYCAGHLMEAAVAVFDATGKDILLKVMCRYADYIATVFGPGEGRKRGIPGHEEIELALVKLYRATGERRYLDLARFFIDQRGRHPHYFDLEADARGRRPVDAVYGHFEYNQAHRPVRQQDTVVGHAVRAMYLYCGMTDIAVETHDTELLAACRRLWRSGVRHRMHITGGLGPTHRNEGFTADYDLPNEGAYLETCAAIGLVFWAHRMLQAEMHGDTADVMERALYNGTVSGVSLGGDRFFYGNPLAAYPGCDGNGVYQGETMHYRRSEWFGCACCPPNIARMIAQVPGYIYAAAPDAVAVHLYAQGSAVIETGETRIRIRQQTDYPWNGTIRIAVDPECPARWRLALRIPGWCRKATLAVNGQPLDLPSRMHSGYAWIEREWQAGDTVELTLAMPVERIEARPEVRQDCGRIALQRGPVVYCLEQVDNGPFLNDLALPRDAALTVSHDPNVLNGVAVISGMARRRSAAGWDGALYRPARGVFETVPIRAVPYALWGNREPGEMLVWIREDTGTAG